MNRILDFSSKAFEALQKSANQTTYNVQSVGEFLEYWINRCAAAEALINAIDCRQYVTNEEQANALLRWQNELRKVGELNTEPKH